VVLLRQMVTASPARPPRTWLPITRSGRPTPARSPAAHVRDDDAGDTNTEAGHDQAAQRPKDDAPPLSGVAQKIQPANHENCPDQ